MKAFRLGKSKKSSKSQLKNKTISTVASNASLRSNLKHDKAQAYTPSLYSSLNRSANSPNSAQVPINSNTYTNYLASSSNTNSMSRTPKSLPRNASSGKVQIVPEFRVGIRLRPMLKMEHEDDNSEELVYLFPQNNILCIREPGSDRLPEIDDGPPPPPGTIAPSMGPYISTNSFNYVFGGQSNSQEEVYFQSVHPLVEQFHNGKNTLVLAYGQMGSGKTYTIGFQPEDYNLENFRPDAIGKDLGFVPRAFQETLSYIRLLKSQNRSVSLLVTFIAISCEDIADLLGESITRYKRPPSPGPKMSSPNDKRSPTTQPKTITVHDRGKQGTYLKGAKYERVESMERLAELLYRGTTFRRIVFGPDSENLSHAILSFHLEQDNPKNSKEKIYSKLNFVDLSCTEKIDKVEARMNRMECGVNDKSWLALSKVINLLTGNRPKGYIPYRDSKLTQVLQDSLSGDAIVLFLSCLSPTACDESKSVLKYMIRSTNIDQRNTVVPPKYLKSIIYNLENMLNGSPTTPVNAGNISFSHSSNINDNSPALTNLSSTAMVNRTTPSLNEISNSMDSSFSRNSNPNQSLESIKTSSMSRLAANSNLLFNSPESPSPIGTAYEEEVNRKSKPYSPVNVTTKTAMSSLERPPRRPVIKHASNLQVEDNHNKLTNRTSQASLQSIHSVPSINSLHNSLVSELKTNNNTTGMTQMLEEQLNALNRLSEDATTIEAHSEPKGHRKKNSEGKKRISFHKRILSFHKSSYLDINKAGKEEAKEKDPEPSQINPVPMAMAPNDENFNNHINFMLDEIKTTIGDKVKQGSVVSTEEGHGDTSANSVQNLDKLVYYLKILLQNYSKNQDEVKKLTAIINNSDIVNNSNYLNNPLSAVVSDVENLKYVENLGNVVPKPVNTPPSVNAEKMNIANTTPPPSHPPPPLPIESPAMVPPSYSKGNSRVVSTRNAVFPMEGSSATVEESNGYARKNIPKEAQDLSSLINKGKSVLKNSSSIYSMKSSPVTNSPNAFITEDMVMEDMDQAELNKYITNLSMRLKNSINEVKEEKDKCDLLRQKEKNLERKLRIRDKELEALHQELDEKVNSFNNAVKVLVMQLGMAQESKNKTQEELSSVEYRTMELAKSLETISELMNGERKNTRNAEEKYHHFVSEYEEEINILQGEKSQMMHEKETLQQQNANLQSKINKLVKTLKKFQVNLIESEKRNYYDATTNMANLKNENNLLKRKLEEISQTKSYIESRYRQLQAEYEKQKQASSSSYYNQEEREEASSSSTEIENYKKELEELKKQFREADEAHQTEMYKLLDRLAVAEGRQNGNGPNTYITELEKKLEKSIAAQKELKEKLKNSEMVISKQSQENKELENKCLSFKKSVSTLQDTVSTYENHQTKLLNTNYNLSSQLNSGKKGKSLTTRSYSGFRTIMHDIKKMTVTELQDEIVELRQEIESMNKKNWDLKLEVDRYQSANESNRRTIMLLMKRINGEKNSNKKDEENMSTIVEGEENHNSSFTKDPGNIRNSNSSVNSKHESNTTLLNSETYDEEYTNKPINKLPVLSEAKNEMLVQSDDDETANVSPFLINKSNSSSSSTAINLPIHAMPNHEGFIAKDTETRSVSEVSSSSDFSMIKVNDEVCIRESTLSTDSMKYSGDLNYTDF